MPGRSAPPFVLLVPGHLTAASNEATIQKHFVTFESNFPNTSK
jgi:hypothetical protein